MEHATPFQEIPSSLQKKREQRIGGIETILQYFAPNETTSLLEDAITLSKANLFARYDTATTYGKSLLAAVVFAIASGGALTETSPVEKQTSLSYEASFLLKKEMTNIVGFDIAGEAMKVGRTAVLSSPTTSGKPSDMTIVHVGQRHTTTQDANYEFRNAIAKSQGEIAQFLATTTTSDTKVFIEGHTTEGMSDTIRARSFKTILNKITSFSDVVNQYEKLYDIEYRLYSSNIPELNKQTGDKLTSIGFKEDLPLSYVKGDVIFVLKADHLFPDGKAYKEHNEKKSLIKGAANMLDAEGVFRVGPAETRESAGKSSIYEKVLQEKWNEIRAVVTSPYRPIKEQTTKTVSEELPLELWYTDSTTINTVTNSKTCKLNPRCQTLVEEIRTKIIPAMEKSIMGDREDTAVELIAKAASSGQKVFPLVYGSAHDFTNAVIKWNYNHPEMQFNLATVK